MVQQGWYADPWGEATLRWWDGLQWTAWTHTDESPIADQGSPESGSERSIAVVSNEPEAVVTLHYGSDNSGGTDMGEADSQLSNAVVVADATREIEEDLAATAPDLAVVQSAEASRESALKQSRAEIPPWQRSKFERLASGGGIAFERNNLVPLGQALLACDPWAACVITSDSTADGMTRLDDEALWAAVASHGISSREPVVVNLPSFGGGGAVEEIPVTHPVHALSAHAVSRAQSFLPYDGKKTDEYGDYYFDPDEDVRDYWTENPPYYRRFLAEAEEDAPRIRWLDDLRNKFTQQLITTSVVHDHDERPRSKFKIRRWGAGGRGVIVTNENGGRIGKIRNHPVLEARLKMGHGGYLDFLLLADEFDRPAAVEALAREGIDLPYDPVLGWLNASVEPGLHGWLDVYWSGRIVGLDLKPRLATFNIDAGTLHVFASQLAGPIEMLLRRVGQCPAEVIVEPHPDGPGYFFGIDILQAATDQTPDQRPVRRLRQEARELLPAEWAEQLEKVWSPEEREIDIPPGLFWDEPPTNPGKRSGSNEPIVFRTSSGCRLCTWSSGGKSYCRECVKEAAEGIFTDRGFDEGWKEAVVWSLQTLAEIEFGGPPALNQLKKPPAEGDNSDLLMLCRILTSRRGWTEMGADRKAYAWTDWLAEAGLLADGLRTSRGVTVMAKDGHICRSLLEREIDDFFFEQGIQHEPEPNYPFDPEHNVGGYRADWKLADGTFVEALGFPNNSEYMAKADRKLKLAALNGISVLTVTHEDIPRLFTIFEKWLPPEDERVAQLELPPRPKRLPEKPKKPGPNNGKNATNMSVRRERLQRCQEAVELQAGGETRKQIAARFAVSEESVASLLRDGKFYADPASDPVRLGIAKSAAAAQQLGMTRADFRAEKGLSAAKADEAWRDADVMFGDASAAKGRP